GTYGNVILANGTPNAEFTATTRLVRLRLLHGSNARTYDFTLGDGRSFLQVGTDGGLLDAPYETDPVTLTPGERADIVVSLDGMAAGASVDLLGSGARVLRLAAAGTLLDNGQVAEVLNRLPATPDPGGTDRRFDLSGMGMMFMINGQAYDPHRVDERGVTGRDEVWEIRNLRDMMGGMVHNFHLHGTQFRVLTRNVAAPAPGERGWKDTVALMPGEAVRILVRFEDEGLFMYHCHILEHEDLGMMGQIEVTAP
ncbi:MAG TPA: multicopper oxidase domain-containing protein, partial [Candidatus Limnocylindria bacterium]|nr:multicopper oxidase domain-containing protein [Candidatus Limnocylindria bacterium]